MNGGECVTLLLSLTTMTNSQRGRASRAVGEGGRNTTAITGRKSRGKKSRGNTTAADNVDLETDHIIGTTAPQRNDSESIQLAVENSINADSAEVIEMKKKLIEMQGELGLLPRC